MLFTNTTRLMIAGALLLCAGCSTVGGWMGRDGDKAPDTASADASGASADSAASADGVPVAAPAVVAEASPSDQEEMLRREVRRDIESEIRSREEDANKVVRRKPYYYREYAVYPSGSENIQVILQEQESRTRPLLADVEVEKQRFSTKLHRKRDEAARDVSFIRDTGTETITYELRGGKWVRIGSLYVADKTEEQVNGEWVPLREEVERTVASEEESGWFGRQWIRVKDRF
jgi:hypothetical protein